MSRRPRQIETVSYAAPPPFMRHGPAAPVLPVVIAVPHAGKHYSSSIIADAAVPLSRLRMLEDRHADRLVTHLAQRGATIFVAAHARALIDLNRDPREIDAAMIEDSPTDELLQSSRIRNGLGLIPRHIGGSVPLWRRRFAYREIRRRIDEIHTPYHQAIAAALASARERFGTAVLLDCHSMPPIRMHDHAMRAPTVVIGDRFGRSACGALGDLVETVVRQAGFPVARNTPYAGGYSLDRHGAPRKGIHALQVEIDRSLYLDSGLGETGEGLPATQALVTMIFDALCEDAQAIQRPIAAE